jgi:ABC-type Zn uptake system ZnuABC Zn-binding protein ZnuA
MIVWILQTGEPLHSYDGSPRSMRAMNFANALVNKGHDVILWSSGFLSSRKKTQI